MGNGSVVEVYREGRIEAIDIKGWALTGVGRKDFDLILMRRRNLSWRDERG